MPNAIKATTRSGLTPAIIENLATNSPEDRVYCMFNPQEYTLTKRNQYSAEPAKGMNMPTITFVQAGAETLTLQLFFDTCAEGTDVDVRVHTEKLWKMMLVCPEKTNERTNKGEPPPVAFCWGKFRFEAVITDITQKFTLFSDRGTPVRTTVDVTFQQIVDAQLHHRQNPTSGGGPAMRTYTVRAGDRLDLIAYEVYEDATQWRPIARANGISDPRRMREGQRLVIPPLA